MKQKGFTLIELLAVIVILAIIAVITVPKVADMISSSRKGGAENSFYGTLKAAELGYAKALQSNTELKQDSCIISGGKITCSKVKVEVSGKTPEEGIIAVSSNGVAGANITLNGYKCSGTLSTPNPCKKENGNFEADKIKEKIVTTGDGLYIDESETGRFIYRGSNPDNNITFNGEDYRIMAIEPDNTFKIIKNDSIGKMAWDERTDEYSGPRLNSNNTYCGLYDSGFYHGCNAWGKTKQFINNDISGTVNDNSSLNNYLNDTYYQTLSAGAKSQIAEHDFNGGIVPMPLAENILAVNELVLIESKIKWKNKIALLSISDFIKASTNNSCKDLYSSRKQPYPCYELNYLSKNTYYWTLNPWYDTKADVWMVTEDGRLSGAGINSATSDLQYAARLREVYPALYLKNDIKLTGSGTESNPYQIK